MPCILCNQWVEGSQIAIMLARDPGITYHATCLHNEGGELLREARELWKDLGHAESWDAMIASQTGAG